VSPSTLDIFTLDKLPETKESLNCWQNRTQADKTLRSSRRRRSASFARCDKLSSASSDSIPCRSNKLIKHGRKNNQNRRIWQFANGRAPQHDKAHDMNVWPTKHKPHKSTTRKINVRSQPVSLLRAPNTFNNKGWQRQGSWIRRLNQPSPHVRVSGYSRTGSSRN